MMTCDPAATTPSSMAINCSDEVKDSATSGSSRMNSPRSMSRSARKARNDSPCERSLSLPWKICSGVRPSTVVNS